LSQLLDTVRAPLGIEPHAREHYPHSGDAVIHRKLGGDPRSYPQAIKHFSPALAGPQLTRLGIVGKDVISVRIAPAEQNLREVR
jgi:hypothetical protein